MIAALTDHLWQSLLCLLAASAFAALLGNAGAVVRLWVWRVAALKFVLPFALLRAFGGWLGFPVMHASEPAPASLVALIAELRPLFAPARSHALEGSAALFALGLLLVVSAGWVLWILRELRVELALARWQSGHASDESEPQPRPVGFLRAATLTLFVLAMLSAPAIAGAVHDRQQRHRLLVVNSLALRDGAVRIHVANPGQGGRPRVIAGRDGVRIRNASVQELIAISFGVSAATVMGDQVVSRYSTDPYDYWMISPRYDVEIRSPVLEPENFDAYALHLAMTRLMAGKFGIEIHVNGTCQAPCGRWGSRNPPARD